MFDINRLARNFLSTGVGSILSQILVFLTGAYYARIIKAENFGIISLVQIFIMYFTSVTLFGLQTYGTREISKNGYESKNLLSDIVGFRYYISILSFIALIVVSLTFKRYAGFGSMLILYGLTIFPIAFNVDWFFNGIQEMGFNAIFNIIKSLVPFLVVILFLRSSKDIAIIPAANLIGILIAVLYQWYIVIFKKKLSTKINFSIVNFRKFFVIGTPFVLSGVLSMFNNYLDRLVLGFTRTSLEVGVYSSAYYIIMFLINIIAMVYTPVFPLLIKYYHGDREKLKSTSSLAAKFVLLISCPITAGGMLLSKEIIYMLFGTEYVDAYRPLAILMIYIFILFIRELFGYQLNAWGEEKTYLRIILTSTALNLVLNLIFTPRFGMVSAACVTLFCEVLNFFLMFRSAGKIMRTKLAGNLLRVLVPTVAMSLFIIAIKNFNFNTLFIIFLSIVVYFSSIILSKAINKRDIVLFIRNRSEI